MTLQNLLRIGKLKEHAATRVEIQQQLRAAERNLAYAEVTKISAETRFDAAYKAVMQCALGAMLASGYRPSTSEPGHHVTLIQSLPLTMGIADDVWIVLDALRRKRNSNDYTGDVVTDDMVAECSLRGASLVEALKKHLKRTHPQFLNP